MDNNNNERNKPDISFGQGAPAGTLDKPDFSPAETVKLGKPAGNAPTEPVKLDKPMGSAPAEPVKLDKPASQTAAGTAAPITNTADRKHVVRNRPPMAKPPVSARKPEGTQTDLDKADITANFGSRTTETKNAPAPSEDRARTRSFSARPHPERAVTDIDPENEDITRHFGRTAQSGNTDASAERTRPARTAAPAENAEETEVRPAPRRRRPRKKKKEHMFNTSIITGLTITIVVISASIVLATQGITLGMEYLGYNKSDKEVTFNIPEGATSEDIINLLMENNIINNRNLFKAALHFSDVSILYPGDITLRPNKSYPEIIADIGEQRDLYETVTLTFQEGTNLRAVANKLEKNGVCTAQDFLWQFNRKLDLPLDSKITHSSEVYFGMEGYFFPDTYEFYKNDSAYNVSKIVRENFDSKITPDMYTRMSEMGMDLNQVVTIASIVQKEAGNLEQMPIIASIFLNRLKDPQTFPRLESDPTRNYVKNIINRVETSSAMLEHYRNVYDTYVCFGLPAGPISNPGLDAIKAVLYPADTNYYFFCNNLETHEAFYAETYEQHKKNLKKAGLTENNE